MFDLEIFFTAMSHELRTPLNAIIGYAQVLRMRHKDDKSLTDAPDTIQQSGKHLLMLINDILDLSTIEAGRMKLCPAVVHFEIFLEGIAGLISLKAQAKQLIFQMDVSETLPRWIETDETRLRQVLLNLLGNAVKYTHHGTVSLTVQCRDTSAASQAAHPTPQVRIRFEITDTGVGIAQDQIDRIFQPFEQGPQMDPERAGTGLGLPISRQLVRLLGSELHVHSTLGKGSSFWFDAVFSVPSSTDDLIQPRGRVITGYTGPRLTVLVADDISSNRTILTQMLAEVGFEVIEATDGRQAEYRQAGINAFLPKPIHWPQLAALLDAHLKINWVYTREADGQTSEEHETLVPPPSRELERLYEMALRGNLRSIYEQASRLEKMDRRLKPFAQRLKSLAQTFEDRAILTLIRQYIEE